MKIAMTLSSAALLLAAAFARAGTNPAPASNFADTEIVGVIQAANEVEIEAANVAQSRAGNSDVSMFARHMIDDHTAARDEYDRLGIKASNSESSVRIRESARFQTQRLERENGAAFDRSYVRGQVAKHEKLLAKLDSDLIPDARNESLATLLRATRAIVVRHLDEAKRLQAQLEGK